MCRDRGANRMFRLVALAHGYRGAWFVVDAQKNVLCVEVVCWHKCKRRLGLECGPSVASSSSPLGFIFRQNLHTFLDRLQIVWFQVLHTYNLTTFCPHVEESSRSKQKYQICIKYVLKRGLVTSSLHSSYSAILYYLLCAKCVCCMH